METVVGIDPGAKGALAIVARDFSKMVLLSEVDASCFNDLIQEHNIKHAFIEKAQAMPGQGVVAMFNYGVGFGRLLAWCEAFKVPFTLIPPQTWTKRMHKGCTGKDAKAKSLIASKRLFPNEKFIPKGCRVPHMGLVDARLIAEYGRLHLGY